MPRIKGKFQTYADGWGTSYRVIDRRTTAVRQEIIHFQRESVGEQRKWDAASVAGINITAAVTVPYESLIEEGDIFEIQGEQFEVVQKQLKDRKQPMSWLLSLQKPTINYGKAGR